MAVYERTANVVTFFFSRFHGIGFDFNVSYGLKKYWRIKQLEVKILHFTP